MRGAGVVLKSRETSFDNIVQRSTISLFRKGSYGIILKCTLPPGESPYVDSWSGEPITVILIKCMALEPRSSDVDIRIHQAVETVTSVEVNEFESEVAIQEELYSRTASNPICPAILKADVYTLDAFERLLPGVTVDRRRLRAVPTMGVIAMEIVSDPLCFAELYAKEPDQFRFNAAKARAKLLEMGSLGYVHGDHHGGNVVFSRADGRVYLIDFGQTTPFYPDDFTRFKKAMYRKNYTYALRLMMFAKRLNDKDGFFSSYITPTLKNDPRVKYIIKMHWATSHKIDTILRTLAPEPLLQYFATLYGWVFAESVLPGRTPFQGPQLLTLTPSQKKDLVDALAKDSATGPLAGWPLARHTRRSPRTSPGVPIQPNVTRTVRWPRTPSPRVEHSPLPEGVDLYH